MTIPVRATVLSALTLVPYLLMGCLLNISGIAQTTAGSCLALLALLVNAIRCPLSTAVTFAAKRRETESRFLSRNQRQRKEIESAREAAKARREKREEEGGEASGHYSLLLFDGIVKSEQGLISDTTHN